MDAAADFYGTSQGLTLSSVGLGTYLGQADERTDQGYQLAIRRAIALGCNHLDTAVNYRAQHSERAIGEALETVLHAKECRRDEIFVSTKGGYVPDEATALETMRSGLLRKEDIVAGCHAMSASYIEAMLRRSLANLRLDTVDLYYLHNPEQQLEEISQTEFSKRLRAAFELLEKQVVAGTIRFYGTATWNGYRVDPGKPNHLSLERIVAIAREVGGADHHFRFVQAPFNLEMKEAAARPTQMLSGKAVPLLLAARQLGVSVVCSGSLLQSRLASGLPHAVKAALPEAASDAQRALQYVRSTPGVCTALAGMSKVAHVDDNLGVRTLPRTPWERIAAL